MGNRELFILILMLKFSKTVFLVEADDEVRGKGTFKLNGIFPYETDGYLNYQSGIMMSEAMKFAVKSVNEDKNLLYGYNFSINKLFNAQTESEVRVNVLNTFLARIPFLIGPYSSETSYLTGILTATFRQVTVSYGGGFTDFDEAAMFRTVPSNFFRIEALLSLVSELQWNYVAVVSSYGHDGERDATLFTSRLSSIGACLADQIDLPREPDETMLTNSINALSNDKRIKAIIMFTKNNDSRSIFQTLKQLDLATRFRIICVFGCTNYKEVVEDLEDVAMGTISLDIHYKKDPEFEKYFLSRTPKNNNEPMFIKFWEKIFNCSLVGMADGRSKCTGNERLEEDKGYFPLTPIYNVINAVYSIAYAVNALIEIVCHKEQQWMSNSTECVINPADKKMYSHMVFNNLVAISYPDGTLKDFRPYSNEVRYDVHVFTKEREKYKSVNIGKWVINRTENGDRVHADSDTYFKLDLSKVTQTNITSYKALQCSAPCLPGFIRISDSNAMKARCCWTCKRCSDNSISRNGTCEKCKKTEKPLDNICVALPEKFLHIQNREIVPFSVTILLLSTVGILFTIFVVIMFIQFNGNRIVRAYGRDLCYMIMTGIIITFLCPFPFLAKPSTMTCVLRGSLPGIGFLTCYAPLFLKVNRIYRIFLHAQTSVARPALVSSKSLLLCSFGIVSVQLLLAGVWFVSKKPAPEYQLSPDHEHILLHCNGDKSPLLMILNLLLSVIFMLSSTVLAFKTRHFPKNYNESKYIGITLYITCVAWALFFPAYFFTANNVGFQREYLTCVVCVLVGYITLFGLFGPKVKILLCTPKGKLSQHSNGLASYSFSFDPPPHANEANGLALEHHM